MFYDNLASALSAALKADTDGVFNQVQVAVRASDGYINMSQLAAAGGTDCAQYLRNKKTQRLLSELKGQFSVCEKTESEPITRCGTNHGGANYWAHPMVIIDFAAWMSTSLHMQVIAWIVTLLSTGTVSLEDHVTATTAIQQLDTELQALRTSVGAKEQEIAELRVELNSKDIELNKYKMRRHRPQLPKGTGLYVGYCENMPDRCMLGVFDKDPLVRHRSYHTHSMVPMRFGAVMYTPDPKMVEGFLLASLRHMRPNTNEVVQVPVAQMVTALEQIRGFLQTTGTVTQLLTEANSDELVAFNASVDDIPVPVEAVEEATMKREKTKTPASCGGCNRMFPSAQSLGMHLKRAREATPCHAYRASENYAMHKRHNRAETMKRIYQRSKEAKELWRAHKLGKLDPLWGKA